MDFLLIIFTIIIGVLTFLLLKKERVLGINTDDSKTKIRLK
jgi:two-component system phosphate regulon sensor histidine kinase PhoR